MVHYWGQTEGDLGEDAVRVRSVHFYSGGVQQVCSAGYVAVSGMFAPFVEAGASDMAMDTTVTLSAVDEGGAIYVCATPLEAGLIALVQQASYLRSVGGDDEDGFGFGGLRVPVGRN